MIYSKLMQLVKNFKENLLFYTVTSTNELRWAYSHSLRVS
jgi:hypothetical protein